MSSWQSAAVCLLGYPQCPTAGSARPQTRGCDVRSGTGRGQNGSMARRTMRTTEVVTVRSQPVRVIRSSRRTRNIHARWNDGMIEVSVPMRLTKAQVTASVERMVVRLQARAEARHDSDPELHLRARQLAATWLGGSVEPTEVVWSTRQMHSWGSCTSVTGRIRISAKVKPMPQWVQDGVIIHELAHLKYPHHGPEFWAFAGQYPRLAESKAYLDGVTFATSQLNGRDAGFGDVRALDEDADDADDVNDVDAAGETEETGEVGQGQLWSS